MKRLLEVLVLLPLAVVVVLLAVANRHGVALSINPFAPANAATQVRVPLYWVIFGALALGVALGGVVVWVRQRRYRRAARRYRRELERLREEIKHAQQPPVVVSGTSASRAGPPATVTPIAPGLPGPTQPPRLSVVR